MNRTLRRVAAPGVVALALGLAVSACGSESSSQTLKGAGSSAQESAMKAWRAGYQKAHSDVTVNYDPVGSGGGLLKSDMAQFRELQAFAQMGSELDKISQAQLDRGYRLTELLKQPLNSPMPVEEQVVVLMAGTRGNLDVIPVTDVRRYESELLAYFRTRHGDILSAIKSTGAIPDEAALEAAITAFGETFVPTAATV